jgi:hypothetical protein
LYKFFIAPMRATFSAHPILDMITPVLSADDFSYAFYCILRTPFSLLGPNVLFRSLFTSILNLCMELTSTPPIRLHGVVLS